MGFPLAYGCLGVKWIFAHYCITLSRQQQVKKMLGLLQAAGELAWLCLGTAFAMFAVWKGLSCWKGAARDFDRWMPLVDDFVSLFSLTEFGV